MDESWYTNVLVAPVCISMLLNLLFLCNIVRVVLLKLKAPAGNSGAAPSRTILQAFRWGNLLFFFWFNMTQKFVFLEQLCYLFHYWDFSTCWHLFDHHQEVLTRERTRQCPLLPHLFKDCVWRHFFVSWMAKSLHK